MGLLDRLLRGRRTPDASEARPLTGEEVLARWRYLLGTAPPEALSAAHTDGLGALGETARAEVLHRLRAALSALEAGAVVPSDAAVLMRAAARAERRAPGFFERALATDARGRQALGGLAAAVVVTSSAAPFLRGFEPGLGEEALADRRAPDFDVEASEESGAPPAHDDDLGDED
ncbi:MAG TPA: hypothetical protein VMT11_19995 [Myxococcaceae bacterium]|nr:hypothetical protein [Myxococcaceae bacterium]